jgi:putative ABC transport system substrate-binding protein
MRTVSELACNAVRHRRCAISHQPSVISRRLTSDLWLVVSFCLLLTVLLPAGSSWAQQSKLPRIGFLAGSPPAALSGRIEAFRDGLRERGYVDGKTIVVEYRYGDGKLERLPALASELVQLKVKLIVTAGSQATLQAKQATSTIPIVMAQDNDPVGSGFVSSLDRPGGNITGIANLTAELTGKQMELLKEILPKLTYLGVLRDLTEPGNPQAAKEIEVAGRAYGVQPVYMDTRDPKDLDGAFRKTSPHRPEALLVLPTAMFNSNRKQIVDLAAKSRLPAIYPRADYVEDGGLMTYGVNINDLYRRAATFVDKILKGAKPGELPIEQPTKFELVINLKAAKQIGLSVPANVLARADKVIR